jgi:WD40 repeat protein/serine/threonine protein kinase/DNA-binding SARP family transcriptional activator
MGEGGGLMSHLSLVTLGSLRIEINDRVLERFRTNRVPAMLLYLAVEDALHGPRPHRRDKIMALLWPGLPEKSARANLRQNLYLLRKTIAAAFVKNEPDTKPVEFLLGDYQSLQINPQTVYDLDVAAFISLLHSTYTHDHLYLETCSLCQQRLQEATTLYQGPFLTDFYLPDSDGFEEWAYKVRDRLQCQVLDALETLTAIHISRGNYAHAEVTARQQLGIDRLRESAYRQLMELLARSGRSEEALAEYESYRRVLRDELGMAPTAKTNTLYQKIVASGLDLSLSSSYSVRGYNLHEQIGNGDYGAVYRASQPSIGREVAIKVIQPQFANHPQFIRRFETEAQLVARLEHPHIVPLYDYWREPDGAYLVMRWLRNGSLQARLADGPLDLATTVTVVDQIASALHAAHRQGVVHRDIKPANILLDEDDNAYLSDFGIAIDVERQFEQPDPASAPSSPMNISPEQLLNEPVTPLTDLYSFGLVLYELLTGEHPFAGCLLNEITEHQLHDLIPFVQHKRDDIPPAVDTVIQRATAKHPSARFPDALSLAVAFRTAAIGGKSFDPQWSVVRPPTANLVNPYKGLHAFQEADAAVFYGRVNFVNQLVSRLSKTQFLAVVGPSGSGKSSVVRAGLIPALRQGSIPGSQNWFIATMTPGAQPLHELQIALTKIAIDPPSSLLEPLQKDTKGLTRLLKRILPIDRHGERTSLLLLIDQFEELFTMVDDQVARDHFLDSLLIAMAELGEQLHVVVTLRADFYDRPLQYASLGEQLRRQTELVLPMTTAELEDAICGPVAGAGIILEPQLVVTLVADVQEQPGALPLLQYALTELFERRQGTVLTLAAYEEIGGISGALSRRAEALYAALNNTDKETTRQLFLRLVTLGEGGEDTRRRVPLAELNLLLLDNQHNDNRGKTTAGRAALHGPIIDQYGRYRLLTFDHDPVSRTPTVEVAHESLLREWPQLRMWLDESRADVRQQRLLASATAEWLAAGGDEGFLLSSARLDQFSGWAQNSTIALNQDEQDFLSASLAARQSRLAAEESRRQRELQTAQQLAYTERQRTAEQTSSNRRLRRRAFLLAGALLVAAVLAVLAIAAGRQANQNARMSLANAKLAITREAQALIETQQRATAEAVAVAEREQAQAQERQSRARALAGASVKNLPVDPELSVLLALQALETTYNNDGSWTPEAVDALHQAIRSASRLQGVLMHSGGAMNGIQYSPDGALLAASTLLADQEVMTTVWRAATAQELFTLPTSIMDFSEDSSRLITWYVNQDLKLVYEIRDALTAEKLAAVTLAIDNIGMSSGGAISADWRYAAIRYTDGTVDVWDVATEEKIGHLTEHDSMVNWVEFSPDNTYVASADAAGQVKLWQVPTAGEDGAVDPPSLLSLPHSHAVSTAVFSPDSSYLATISDNYTVTIWDIAASLTSGTPRMISQSDLAGYAERISQIAFNKQGSMLAAVSKDGLVKLWDAFSGSELLTLISNKHTRHVAFSPDGAHLVTANDGGLVQTWDITTEGEREFLTISGHDGIVNHIAYSPDGRQLATAGSDQRIRLWDAVKGDLLMTLTGHSNNVRAVAFDPQGSLLATASNDGTIKLWESDSGREIASLAAYANLPMNPIPENNTLEVAFSPDGSTLIAAGMSPTPQVWDLATGQSILTLHGHDYNVPGAAVSPDGSQLATVGFEGRVIVWDSKTGAKLFVQPTSIYGSLDVAFSPDGRSLATADADGIVRVWSLDAPPEERLLFTLPGHGATVYSVVYSPDGRFVASASANLTRIWDAATGQPLYTLPGHTRVITDLAFSPDSAYLASSSADGTVRIYVLPIDDLMALARSRLTRTLTDEECRQYLQMESCPDKR